MSAKSRVHIKGDVGAHLHLDDPYLFREGYKEPTICPGCKAIYTNKKWSLDEKQRGKIEKTTGITYQMCPACRKIKDRFPMGILTLSGEFLFNHHQDILNLLRSEEKRAVAKNPLERIISIEERKGTIQVETTTESLALRMGRVLFRAYKGNVSYKFSQDEKLVRVNWNR